ncbi:MAG: hypothetical protein A2Y38_15515 [Spirochaetes bacterium GWB1_59_5]|nr:MAG: hypothetical protein A2Y38_15515 [Spirochaetes bacterium GWB1_59_5]
MIIPDEQLNHLADRFIGLQLQALTGSTFEQYLADPEEVEAFAFLLVAGGGINICEGQVRRVTLH